MYNLEMLSKRSFRWKSFLAHWANVLEFRTVLGFHMSFQTIFEFESFWAPGAFECWCVYGFRMLCEISFLSKTFWTNWTVEERLTYVARFNVHSEWVFVCKCFTTQITGKSDFVHANACVFFEGHILGEDLWAHRKRTPKKPFAIMRRFYVPFDSCSPRI